MRITLVSSCGLVLEAEGRTLLVDALNKQFRCYYGQVDAAVQRRPVREIQP